MSVKRSQNAGSAPSKSRKRSVEIRLNERLQDPDIQDSIRDTFSKGQPPNLQGDKDVELITDPFFCCILRRLFDDDTFLESAKEELQMLDYHPKDNDLYKFHQSKDLKTCSSPNLTALRRFLYKDFLEWLQSVTGITFTETVDMTSASYDYTDVLLCHDDELEGRRIAFILYFVPNSWSKSDGGSLCLFNRDENEQPKDVACQIVPSPNSFVFFEVTAISFHQVAEILAEDKTRLSISGWFHGPAAPRPPRYLPPPAVLEPPGFVDESVVYDWINPTYLDESVCASIRGSFEDDSEVELTNFLKEEKYEEVLAAVKEASLQWQNRGPANVRNYKEADPTQLPAVLRQCIDLLKSEAVFLILGNITGLKLHHLVVTDDESSDDETAGSTKKKSVDAKNNQPSEDDGTSCCQYSIRRWSHGSYTLIHDDDRGNQEFALDATLFLGATNWNLEYGGYTSYIARGEDEELLSVFPAENALALVYRDKDTLRFVKHINHRVTQLPQNQQCFYDVSFTYYT